MMTEIEDCSESDDLFAARLHVNAQLLAKRSGISVADATRRIFILAHTEPDELQKPQPKLDERAGSVAYDEYGGLLEPVVADFLKILEADLQSLEPKFVRAKKKKGKVKK